MHHGCIGLCSVPPYLGLAMGFPESLEIERKRRKGRITYEMPECFSAEFRLGTNSKEDRLYQLNVLNRSDHGLGLIVPEMDLELLRILKKGDTLDDITILASWAMIKVSGTVSHITKIEDGKHKGCYLLGIHTHRLIRGFESNIS